MILKTPFPFTNYGVSPCGQVKNRITGRLLKQQPNQDGYLVVGFSQNGQVKTMRVNRLVAILYIPNPNNLPQVNHKDLDKQNNHKSNLEWCTGKENSLHAVANGRKSSRPKRAVYKVVPTTRRVLDKYDSVCEAARINGINFSNIYSVIRGERLTTGGFCWEFA